MMAVVDRLVRWWLVRHQRPQSTFVYCPSCGLELCNTESFDSDTDLVRYCCVQCKARSEWLFDAPVPILIRAEAAGGGDSDGD